MFKEWIYNQSNNSILNPNNDSHNKWYKDIRRIDKCHSVVRFSVSNSSSNPDFFIYVTL